MAVCKEKIWAIDFDGTLYGYDEPDQIPDWNYPLINFLKERQEKGELLILWTCRTGSALEDALEKLKEVDLTFDAINDNVPQIKEKWKEFGRPAPRKVYANVYIDDKFCNDFKLFKKGASLSEKQ